MRRIHLFTEGPHDVEVLAQLVKRRGQKRITIFEKLDEYCKRLVPTTYPQNGDLLARVPTPSFFADAATTVVLHAVGGDSKLLLASEAFLSNLDAPPDALGIVLDGDGDAPDKRWRDLVNAMADHDHLSALSWGAAPGSIGAGHPMAGVFVLPDNQQLGTLEHILLKCAEQVYPKLLEAAQAWIEPLDPDDRSVFVNASDRQDLKKPSGKSKAQVSAIASVLRPGKAIQVSLQDNRWLTDPAALALPEVARLQAFVDGLLGI